VGVDRERPVPLQQAIGITRRWPRDGRDRATPRIAKAEPVTRETLNRVAALVHEPMVAPAEQDKVVKPRFTAVSPVADVVRIHKPLVLAPGEAAAAVTPPQRSA
jgi:hypothetical protein